MMLCLPDDELTVMIMMTMMTIMLLLLPSGCADAQS
jgi:hypothetical protein